MDQTLASVKAANRAAGYHFFDRATMRFFRSKIETGLHDGRYFITSEQFESSSGDKAPRMFTIRRAEPDGSIETVGEFNSYPSLADALDIMRERIKAERDASRSCDHDGGNVERLALDDYFCHDCRSHV